SMTKGKLIISLFCFLTIAFAGTGQRAGRTKSLRISANHRFFADQSGKPFFWLGDTGWLLFSKLDRDEAEKYLEDRRKKGFTVIQVMVLHSLGVVNVYGDSALV